MSSTTRLLIASVLLAINILTPALLNRFFPINFGSHTYNAFYLHNALLIAVLIASYLSITVLRRPKNIIAVILGSLILGWSLITIGIAVLPYIIAIFLV